MASRFVWAASDIGLVRDTNEDRFGVASHISSGEHREQWAGVLPAGAGWAVIADGMGGHEAGEVASGLVVDTAFRLSDRLQSEQGIVSMLNEANVQIFAQVAAGMGRLGMGSTIVGFVFDGPRCLSFNIGDSRLFVLRDTRLLQISVDDTVQTDRRSTSRNHALTQSLGGTRDRVPLFPHVHGWDLRADDVLVLSSDGLCDMLSNEQILQIIAERPEHPALALVDAAIEAGGRDNVTVIVVGAELEQSGSQFADGERA